MVKKVTKTRIIEQYLDGYGKRYYLRELASLLKKPHQTIKPYLEALVKEGILEKTERKNITDYSPNFKNNKVYDYLIIAEKEKLMRRLERDTLLKILFENLSNFFRENTFIIFGSSVDKISKGSDIDLLVIGKEAVSKQIEDFERVYNRKIHKIQVNSIEELTRTLIKEIYKKHIILNNTEDIIRFFGEFHEKNKLV